MGTPRFTDAHGNFVEKRRWTKKRALMEAAQKRRAAAADGFSKDQQKVEAPVARPTFGQRKNAMLTLLADEQQRKLP
jgi:hypothetical protein